MNMSATMATEAKHPAARPESNSYKCRVMIAEDDIEMRKLLAWSIRKSGHETLHAESGTELLDQVAALQLAGEPLDLLITDVRMPGLDGLEALDWLRELGVQVPVIVITAFGDPRTHQEASRLGAWAVLDKPFDLEDFQVLVDKILDR